MIMNTWKYTPFHYNNSNKKFKKNLKLKNPTTKVQTTIVSLTTF